MEPFDEMNPGTLGNIRGQILYNKVAKPPSPWCTNCQNLREQQNIYTTPPRMSCVMFNMVFVGVVRGVWVSNFSLQNSSFVYGAKFIHPHPPTPEKTRLRVGGV